MPGLPGLGSRSTFLVGWGWFPSVTLDDPRVWRRDLPRHCKTKNTYYGLLAAIPAHFIHFLSHPNLRV